MVTLIEVPSHLLEKAAYHKQSSAHYVLGLQASATFPVHFSLTFGTCNMGQISAFSYITLKSCHKKKLNQKLDDAKSSMAKPQIFNQSRYIRIDDAGLKSHTKTCILC